MSVQAYSGRRQFNSRIATQNTFGHQMTQSIRNKLKKTQRLKHGLIS